MISSILLGTVAILAKCASAQSNTQELTIDPNSVPIALRQAWCRAQTASCPQICGGAASPNTCDANMLTYNCVCTDASSPNISDFQQTLPFFICQTWRDQCVAQNPNDLEAQTDCLSLECGQRNATEITESTTSALPTSTEGPSSTASETATTTEAVTVETSEAAAAALAIAQTYGTSIMATVMLAFFGFAL